MGMLDEIMEGRTDLVFEYLAAGKPADAKDADGVSLLQWCAYYGDVSAMKYLLEKGARIASLGENLGLDAACFHGHWRLCQFLIERGADVNRPQEDTGETPLHATLCTTDRLRRNIVMRVLLQRGANPNCATKPNRETGGFMRDCRTRGETPLHRAAAFGDEEAIQLLLDAGAKIDARDINDDTPLSWASWYARPTPILRKLLYGSHRIHPHNRPMEANLVGRPVSDKVG
jgi:ankyrin repeat protein